MKVYVLMRGDRCDSSNPYESRIEAIYEDEEEAKAEAKEFNDEEKAEPEYDSGIRKWVVAYELIGKGGTVDGV